MVERWQPKVDALIRLAAPNSGATDAERATAKRKLALILERHPEAEHIKAYGPVREFMCADLLRMKRAGISTSGSWTAGSIKEAIAKMVADYEQRLAYHSRSVRRLNTRFWIHSMNRKQQWGKV